ncbi:bacteriocin immunity protein [Photobacterium leiognathi]|uniref:bacteriocin immunity protein n=1 Tax=Photobacterium leiognathi TaxID=553611 RepID=UPI002980D989|nr:bacteriocin immunity protein [Photobacterium leiognathi]
MKKNKLEEYTEAEFLQLIVDIFEANGTEDETDHFLMCFHEIVGHPLGASLIVDPTVKLDDDSPKGVLKEVKEWRQLHGLPLFKE